jgi:hypothetical protein
MICQDCGVEAKTKHVSFHQNIGLLILRIPKTVEGRLCKSCIHKHFWGMTTTTFFFGWWGTISFFVTPFFILNNVVRYMTCLSLPPVEPGATRPELTDEAMDKIKPYAEELFSHLNKGEDLESTADYISAKAGVTPGQVVLFLQAIAHAQSQRQW